MEFKGTKGKWQIQAAKPNPLFDNQMYYAITKRGEYNVVAFLYPHSETKKEVADANALLISKAPEIIYDDIENIALINKIVEAYGEHISFADHLTIKARLNKSEQLIKEATDL
jgi:succinyl-CoA synthetase alpha subunit